VAKRRLPPRLTGQPKLGFPLYGHQHLRVEPGFFRGGFLDEAVGVSREVESHLLSRCNPYYVGKLVSIEVFGRLFGMRESEGCVTEHVRKFVSMNTGRQ
jgi:asparagine synthase (glutamine-hydrolysing)